MERVLAAAAVVTALALAWALWRRSLTTTVYDHQKGLLFRRGAFERELDAGTYRLWSAHDKIEVFDLRDMPLSVLGQEMLTADKINPRVTLIGSYRVKQPRLAQSRSTSFLFDVTTAAQLALRDAVARLTLDQLLETQSAIGPEIQAAIAAKAAELGIEISALAVRDVMLPANLKRAYAGVIEAQKEAQRKLEVARGEQAVLRSLANTARLYAETPTLLQARVVQALESGNNSIIFGTDGALHVKPPSPK